MTSPGAVAVLAALCATEGAARAAPGDCYSALDALAVPYSIPARAPAGIDWPVEVEGPLGGVSYQAYGGPRVLVLDCSLVYSLAVAGKIFVDEGVRTAFYGD